MRNLFWILAFLLAGNAPAAPKKTLVYCSEGNPQFLNSILAGDVTSQDVSRHILDTLLRYKRGSGDYEPGLATSWKISPDGRRYTFQLRPGVKFHSTEFFQPTRTMNADDVVYSFERLFRKDHPYHMVSGGVYPNTLAFGFHTMLQSVRALDPLTVEVTLDRPYAPFLFWLGTPSIFAVFSKEYAEKLLAAGKAADFDTALIGTGPFVLKSYVKDSQITMTAFDDYYQGRPAIDKLVFAITTESSVRVSRIAAGECDVAFQPSPADLENADRYKNAKLAWGIGSNIGYLTFNTTKAPFDNPVVRRAVALALNRDSYIKAVYLNHGEVIDAPLPKISWGYSPPNPPLKQDIAESKRLLAAAGFPNGFKTTILALPISRTYNPNGKKLAELMQSDLAKVGITARIEQYEWATHLSKSRSGDFELAQLGWNAMNTDPDSFVFATLTCELAKSGSNRSRWCNPKFDELITKAREILDQKARKKLYVAAENIFHAELPWVTIASGKVYHLVSNKVHGFKPSPDGSLNFYGVSVE